MAEPCEWCDGDPDGCDECGFTGIAGGADGADGGDGGGNASPELQASGGGGEDDGWGDEDDFDEDAICDSCYGGGCGRCGGTGQLKRQSSQSGGGGGGDGAGDLSQKSNGGGGGGGVPAECEWCGGEGCDVCLTCEQCNGAGCQLCGGGPEEAPGDDPNILLQNRAYEAEEELKDRPDRALRLLQEALEAARELRQRQGGSLDDEQQSIAFKARKHILLLTLQGHRPEGAAELKMQDDAAIDDAGEDEGWGSDDGEDSGAMKDDQDPVQVGQVQVGMDNRGLVPEQLDAVGSFLDELSAVTRNEGQQAVEEILAVARGLGPAARGAVFELVRQKLRTQPDQSRLLFHVNNQLCRSHLEAGHWPEALGLLREMHAACQVPAGSLLQGHVQQQQAKALQQREQAPLLTLQRNAMAAATTVDEPVASSANRLVDDPSKSSELVDIYAMNLQLLQALHQQQLKAAATDSSTTTTTSATTTPPQPHPLLQTPELWGGGLIRCPEPGRPQWQAVFDRTQGLLGAGVQNPRSLSLLRETWGKLFAEEGDWQRAKLEFHGAFANYTGAGQTEDARRLVQYVVVANMLAGDQAAAGGAPGGAGAGGSGGSDADPSAAGSSSPEPSSSSSSSSAGGEAGGPGSKSVNLFDTNEFKEFLGDPQVQLISRLRDAYAENDVRNWRSSLTELARLRDPFLRRHLDSIVRDFQRKALRNLVRPYRRVRLEHLAAELQVDRGRVEQLLVRMILDDELPGGGGRLDQVRGILDRTQALSGSGGGASGRNPAPRFQRSLARYAEALGGLAAALPEPEFPELRTSGSGVGGGGPGGPGGRHEGGGGGGSSRQFGRVSGGHRRFMEYD